MHYNTRNFSDAAAVAQFRLALIAPAIHGLFPDASRNAYYQRVTEKPLTLPDGSVFQYSPKTLSKWASLYQNGGIDALMPRECSDKGSTRSPVRAALPLSLTMQHSVLSTATHKAVPGSLTI